MNSFSNQTRVYLADGLTLDVYNPVEDAARMLWGKNDGDDAHDMGYAALQNPTGVVRVDPDDVTSIGPLS
jgi:hypothetical protein